MSAPPELVALVRGDEVRPADPRAFVRQAWAHGLIGFAEEAATAGRWEASDLALAAVRSLRGSATLQAALLSRELPAAAAVLREACGAVPIVIKGPAVAERLYPRAGLRSFGDLDVLVPREALRPAVGALAAAGWEPARTARAYAAMGEPLPGFAEDYGHELHVTKRVGPAAVHLEAHWRVGDDPASSALDHAHLAPRARPLPELGESLAVPSPPDELLILAVHLISHGRDSRLIWHVDLALARDALSDGEWRETFALADASGLGWSLHRALDRVAATMGSDRPRPAMAPARPAWGALRAADSLPPRVAEHVGRLAPLSWSGRIRYALRIGAATARRVRARRRS